MTINMLEHTGDTSSAPAVETIVIPENRLPSPDIVRSLGSVSRDRLGKGHRKSLHNDLPRENEKIVVIARDEEGAPSAAAIAVVSQELPAAASIKRFRANSFEDGLAVIEALQGVVAQRFDGQDPVVHVTPFAEMHHEDILDEVSARGTHSHYGPGRMLRSISAE